MPKLSLEMEFLFAASHRLPRSGGRCANMHGHNYKLAVRVDGVPDAHSGMVLDFEALDAAVKAGVLDLCDHATLNDFHDNPTAENMAVWMWERLKPRLAGLAELRLWEARDRCAVYRGEA